VSANETLKALAVANNATSEIATAAYTIAAATPTYTPAAGKYPSAQSVTINDTTVGATIYYTTDGTLPTTSSSVYSSPITVSANETLKALAVANNYTTSLVAAAVYKIGP
jgi:Chitobiase/beta-hexosaminidase C-terminal domain